MTGWRVALHAIADEGWCRIVRALFRQNWPRLEWSVTKRIIFHRWQSTLDCGLPDVSNTFNKSSNSMIHQQPQHETPTPATSTTTAAAAAAARTAAAASMHARLHTPVRHHDPESGGPCHDLLCLARSLGLAVRRGRRWASQGRDALLGPLPDELGRQRSIEWQRRHGGLPVHVRRSGAEGWRLPSRGRPDSRKEKDWARTRECRVATREGNVPTLL